MFPQPDRNLTIRGPGNPAAHLISIRLPDELAQRIIGGKISGPLQILLDPQKPASNRLICGSEESFELSTGIETQPVDLITCPFSSKQPVQILGQIRTKLAVRQELRQSKAAQIRQKSLEAESSRHARRTVALDIEASRNLQKAGSSKSKRNRTAPSTSANLPTFCAKKSGPLNTSIYANPRRPLPTDAVDKNPDERSSDQSWSPVITEHVANSISSSTSSYDCMMSKNTSAALPKPWAKDPLGDAQQPLIRPTNKRATVRANCSQLEEEFGNRYGEYIRLREWIDNRLGVFEELKTKLKNTSAHPPSQAEANLCFRVVIEQARLRDDQEYAQKLEKLDECCAALLMIKSRLATLAST